MRLVLPVVILEQITRQGEETYPHECCGFMMGRQDDRTREISEIRRQPNERADSRENRFLITPAQFRDAERYGRKAGLVMLGIYHSHPDHPARPSQYDRDRAWPWFSYLIIPVSKGVAGEPHAWQLRDDRSGFDPLALTIKENSP